MALFDKYLYDTATVISDAIFLGNTSEAILLLRRIAEVQEINKSEQSIEMALKVMSELESLILRRESAMKTLREEFRDKLREITGVENG